jgi:iron complex transport system substrate-binding protein
VEAIVAYKPDLVIFWGSGNSQKILQQLIKLNIPVYVDEPGQIKDIAHSLLDLGRLSGNEQQAKEVAATFLTTYADLSSRYSKESKVSVFYQIWDDPLQTLNGSHITSDLINLCGGKNIFAEEPSIAPVISMEAIFEHDPDVILASGISTERPAWLDDWRKYPQLQAVRNEKLMFIPADISQRHTTRIMDGAKHLCAMLSDL